VTSHAVAGPRDSNHETDYGAYAWAVRLGRPSGDSTLVSLVLVAVPLTAFVLAGMRPQTPPPVTAATHLHYFQVGKHECAQTIKKIEAQAPAGQLLGFRVLAGGAGVPKDFRSEVAAGCQAATG
jgi:hypothetical protein